jgi:hypothetical protein
VHFWRAPDKGELFVEVQTEHVGRRIDEAEAAIEIERVSREIGLETLRQDDLKNVAGLDVFFRAVDDLLEFGALEVAARG